MFKPWGDHVRLTGLHWLQSTTCKMFKCRISGEHTEVWLCMHVSVTWSSNEVYIILGKKQFNPFPTKAFAEKSQREVKFTRNTHFENFVQLENAWKARLQAGYAIRCPTGKWYTLCQGCHVMSWRQRTGERVNNKIHQKPHFTALSNCEASPSRPSCSHELETVTADATGE